MATTPLVEQRQLIISVKDYVDDVLGKSSQKDKDDFLNDTDYASIPFDRADAIYAITQNRHTCFIQYPSEDCPELDRPLLWNFNAWSRSVDRHRLAKERSDKERIIRNLQSANLLLIKRAILKMVPIKEEQATMIAWRIYQEKREDQLAFYGVKLKTKEEEL